MNIYKNQLKKLKIGMHVPINVFLSIKLSFFEILIFCDILGGPRSKFCDFWQIFWDLRGHNWHKSSIKIRFQNSNILEDFDKTDNFEGS